MENITLPYDHLFNKLFEEGKFDLTKLKENQLFVNTITDLAGKFIDLIDFEHLKSQREAEKIENQLCSDTDNPQELEEIIDETEEYNDCSDQEEDVILSKKVSVNKKYH